MNIINKSFDEMMNEAANMPIEIPYRGGPIEGSIKNPINGEPSQRLDITDHDRDPEVICIECGYGGDLDQLVFDKQSKPHCPQCHGTVLKERDE